MKKLFALLLVSCLLLAGCAGNEPSESADSSEEEVKTAEFVLVENSTAIYKIISPRETSNKNADALLELNDAIHALTGKYLSSGTDVNSRGEVNPETECEIILGLTNRQASVTAFAALEPYTFSISFEEKKIIIVGYNEKLLGQGIEYFIQNYLSADVTESTEGYIKLLKTDNYCSVSSVDSFKALLASSESHEGECVLAYSVPKPSADIKTVQGGCFAGQYFYQAFLKKDTASNEENNIDRIVKFDTETKETVLTSEDLALNHANDITYNPKINKLVVVHNNPNRTHVSFVDPETLTISETKVIDYKIYCIDYNEAKDCYVIGLSGGQSFRLVDGDFKPLGEVYQPTGLTEGYTTQGCCSDENYIYFVLYKKNVITVYDWSGKFVTLISLDVTAEPENISVVGDTIYVTCATSAAAKIYSVSV